RAQREAGSIEHLLEFLGRLFEVLRDIILERLEAVVAVPCRHLDAGLRMRRRLPELMAAHGVAHPVSRTRVRASRDRGAKPRTKEFAASQHGDLPVRLDIAL